ncbi:MAG: MMPL family transporter [Gammaproteobacteria bacterium]|nr:MMPL family transporter [Gammaproteobacteria bacterium]
MLALSIIVLGWFSLERLGVDLLPHIIYPEVRVRITDPGVPGTIMEDQITRQLEEQLAITEDAISVQSRSSEARSQVDLSFQYGKDIDVALRDASTRLDRAKRFLPDTIEPPVIFKLDPAQIPILDLVASSALRRPSELREWIDYTFSKWFLNLPGMAAVEVGGAPVREIQVVPDQQRLAGFGVQADDLVRALRQGNLDRAGGRVRMQRQVISGRTTGRFETVAAIASLPVPSGDGMVRLRDVAEVIDTERDEKLRIRLDGVPGVKVAFQKQPQANAVAVVDAVNQQLAWLREQNLIPEDIELRVVSDAAVFVRQAIINASVAALSGSFLAMLVVFTFLGDLRRTLIIGSSIPLGIMVAFLLMDTVGLTLNVMTLGGLALGVGLLVDNTVVMLENIYRHQRMGKSVHAAAQDAAREVHGAVVASTSTNLVAVLPFLFVGGLIGLLFRELIATISAAIAASLLVALTVVPALGARVPALKPGLLRRGLDGLMAIAQRAYGSVLVLLLRWRWFAPLPFIFALWFVWPAFTSGKQTLMPYVDDGRLRAYLIADSGISLDEMDRLAARLETLIAAQPEVVSVYAQVGGFVFGRSERQATNFSRLSVQLVPRAERQESTGAWIKRMKKEIRALELAGVRVRMRPQGIRGLRISRGDDDLSLRVRGPDLDVLARIGDDIVARLDAIPGVENARHSAEDSVQELTVRIDRERAAALGLTVEAISRALRIALQGVIATDFIEGDRKYDVRLRFPLTRRSSPRDLELVMLFPPRTVSEGEAIYLGDVASVELVNAPARIVRDRQQRIVEINGNIGTGKTLGAVSKAAFAVLSDYELPPGYTLYDGGASDTLNRSESVIQTLLALAVFLVFVVMAVQYESLRNPLIILAGVPFAAIGVALAIMMLQLPLSMPLWLGLIMLAGIVVNNAIVLVEYIELERGRGQPFEAAILSAGRLRLRPILMTTLTTVVGMLPLALGWGEGAEMLQPLAIAIVWGLSFSTLVSLLLIPVLYRMMAVGDVTMMAAPAAV